MDTAKGKLRRSSSSLLLRITDICKVHSVSVASGIGDKLKADSTRESSEDGVQLKVHPHQVSDLESCSGSSTTRYDEVVVEKLFDAISGLKLAYVKVQQAHVPYDPEKIVITDEYFVSELEETAGLKDLYVSVNKWSNPMYQSHMSSRIHEHQKLAVELQAATCKKDSEIVLLRAELEELERSNMELEEKIDGRVMHRQKSFDIGRGELIDMISELFESSSKCIHDFAKLVVGLMKVSGWDLDFSKFPFNHSVVYEKRAHKKYSVEAYFTRAMLTGTKEEYFSMDSFDYVMSFRDPFDALVEAPNSTFGRFCQEKYLVAVPRSMENSFFGNLDHRAFIESSGHPRTHFYQAFARMARYVWALLTVARYMKPKAEMFFVRSGVQFQKKHMESIPAKLTTEDAKVSVGFTVMPGFKIGCTVIRCRVYLSKVNAGDS
ncbi:protein GRAVITROPIC IN THE LIGHT 1-like [Phragmites australis]|uniref:protein GRAVITROPIC IN THE LIGHT 1-like n=1 Tax=Phragmites australis TaxID=29695 RepID=UPI002D77AB49|nr:protein GRAVITROPIC IN THE LIGHT 1-like [Phragmites australis]